MTWHATGKCTEPDKMQHPVDGRAWKNFGTKYLNFAKKPRNVRLGLAADGFNSFGNLSQSYSMWPAKPGVETIDVATGQKFNMRAMVLWTINVFLLEVFCLGGVDKVFRSICKSIGLRSVIRFDDQELKKGICKFPNKYMKEEFPDWFWSQIRQRHVDKDPCVSACSELFALACGPTPTPISVNSYVVNDVRFIVHSRDECRITQNSGICSPGGKDGEMCSGQLQEILEFSYLLFKVVFFRVKWFDTRNKGLKQVFYLEDIARRPPNWKVVKHVNHKKFLNGGVIMVEDDLDVIHFDNSSDLALSTSLNDLDFATLHIDGQSTDVDTPSDIIDMSADVARGYGGDGGGDDRRPPHREPIDCEGCL
nr:hypothetical protein [Tanacetum cinerariifolium]GEZ64167.1 hypothetical protein [Tanacetum cinerariifolium]